MRKVSVYLSDDQIQALTSTQKGSMSEAVRGVINAHFGLKPTKKEKTKLFSFQGIGGSRCEWNIPLSIVRELEALIESGNWLEGVKFLRERFTRPDGSNYGLFEVKACIDLVRFKK